MTQSGFTDVTPVTQGEEIVDIRPENVVVSQLFAHEPGTRIHFLYQKRHRDAKVVEWFGSAHGSKHKLELEAYVEEDGAAVKAATVTTDLNECNHALQASHRISHRNSPPLPHMSSTPFSRPARAQPRAAALQVTSFVSSELPVAILVPLEWCNPALQRCKSPAS